MVGLFHLTLIKESIWVDLREHELISRCRCVHLTWVCLLSFDLYLTLFVDHWGSSSSSLFLFVFLARSVSVGQEERKHVVMWLYCMLCAKKNKKTSPYIQWKSSWTESSSSWHLRLLSFLLPHPLFSLSLPGGRDDDTFKHTSTSDGFLDAFQASGSSSASQLCSVKVIRPRTATLFCRSLSLSALIFICSALSDLRFSWRKEKNRAEQTLWIQNVTRKTWRVIPETKHSIYRSRRVRRTMRAVRLRSSSSSFLRFSKWASIRVWSSVRSFSIRFRWMSWN